MNLANKWKYLFPAVILGICYINFFCFLLGFELDLTLYGISISTEKPNPKCNTIISGIYQEEYQNWFAEHAPFRRLGIKGYAQLMTTLYAPINGIEIGKNKNLYEDYFTQATLNGNIEDEKLDSYMNDLKIIDKAMKQEEKVFFYLISPAKAEIYPDDLPWNERLIWEKDNGIASIRKKLSRALSYNEIPFLDFTELMQQLREEGSYPPFNKTGIHWNQYGVAYAVISLCEFLNQTFDLNLPDMIPEFTEEQLPQFDEDDIKKITNAFWMPFDKSYRSAKLLLVNGLPEKNVFAMSTSFTYSILYLFAQNKMPFQSIWRTQYSQFQDKLYYNENGSVVWEGFLPGYSPMELNYADIFYYSDMVFIENNAPEIPESHIQFAHEFAEYLKRMEYFTDYMKELYQKEEMVIIFTSNNSDELLFHSAQIEILHQFGISSLEEREHLIGIWEDRKLQLVDKEDYFYGEIGEHLYSVSCSKNQEKSQIVIEFDNKEYFSDIGGLNFFVYDKEAAEIVDWVIFDVNNNCVIYR